MNFLFTGIQSWNIGIGSNAKNIAAELSRHHRVLYINPPQDIVSLLRSGNSIKSGIRKVASNLFVADLPLMMLSISKIKSAQTFDSLNRTNNQKYAASIVDSAHKVGFDDFVHIIDNDIFRSQYLKEYLKPRLQIYYRRDWLLSVDYWRRHASRLEPLLAAKADYVMTNSPYLAQTIEQYNPRTYYVGQGVDLEAYNLSKIKQRILNYTRPIIGCIGAISALRLDADLIYEIVSARPAYSFVMVGAEDNVFRKHKIHTLPNIIFTGLVTPDELPSYIASFDVCINPQAVNQITIGNYPRKIDEYLSLGKPVVATDTPTMKIFEDYVYLCSNVAEYVTAIDKALNSPFDISRTKFAHSHSWENSVNEMVKIITR